LSFYSYRYSLQSTVHILYCIYFWRWLRKTANINFERSCCLVQDQYHIIHQTYSAWKWMYYIRNYIWIRIIQILTNKYLILQCFRMFLQNKMFSSVRFILLVSAAPALLAQVRCIILFVSATPALMAQVRRLILFVSSTPALMAQVIWFISFVSAHPSLLL
jgi:hypothetical protein